MRHVGCIKLKRQRTFSSEHSSPILTSLSPPPMDALHERAFPSPSLENTGAEDNGANMMQLDEGANFMLKNRGQDLMDLRPTRTQQATHTRAPSSRERRPLHGGKGGFKGQGKGLGVPRVPVVIGHHHDEPLPEGEEEEKTEAAHRSHALSRNALTHWSPRPADPSCRTWPHAMCLMARQCQQKPSSSSE